MISKKAKQDYLTGKGLEDYSWIKTVSKRDASFKVKELTGKCFKFKTKPYLHQLVSFYLLTCVTLS